MINPKHAAAILAIVKEGSVTAASKKLFVSQPALSQTVKAVEQELGMPVFFRSGSTLSLTHAGELYIDAIHKMMLIDRDLRTGIEDERGVAHGSFSLGMSQQRCIQLLPEVLPKFSEKYPYVRIDLVEESSRRLESMIRDDRLDMAFITTPEKRNRLRYVPIEEERFVLMASKSTALAKTFADGTEIDISAAENERFICMAEGHGVRDVQDSLFAKYGIRPQIVFETPTLELAKLLTAQMNAVFFVPDIYITPDMPYRESVSVFPVSNRDYERNLYFCYRQDLYLTEYEKDFVRMVCEVLHCPCSDLFQTEPGIPEKE